MDLASAAPAWDAEASANIARLTGAITECEYALIPHGLHVLGEAMSREERLETLHGYGGNVARLCKGA